MYTVQCTVYIVQCTVYRKFTGSLPEVSTVYIVQSTVYNVHCILYIVPYIMYTVQCTLYIVKCNLHEGHSTSTCTFKLLLNLDDSRASHYELLYYGIV